MTAATIADNMKTDTIPAVPQCGLNPTGTCRDKSDTALAAVGYLVTLIIAKADSITL